MLSKKKISYYMLLILMIYFCTKMLWDSITNDFTEYFSLLLIMSGFLMSILRIRKKSIGLLCIFLVFSMYIIFNALFLTDITHLKRGIYEYIFYVSIYFATIGFLKNISLKQLTKIFEILCYVSLFLSILTLIEYIRGVAFISTDGEIAYGTFISGYGYTFRCKVFTRSYLSHGMVMGILSLINLYMYRINKGKRWLIFYILCIIAVLLTSSRGPLVATSIATAYFMIDLEKLKRCKKSTLINSLLIGMGGLSFIYMLFGNDITFENNTIMYFVSRIRNIFNWSGDAGNLGRMHRWETYWNYFKSHNMLFGSGVSVTGTSGCTTLNMGTTESGILKRLVELGIVGTGLYYIFVSIAMYTPIKRLKSVKNEKITSLKKLSIAVLLSVLIDDCILQITEEIMVSFYFWVFLAILYYTTFYYISLIKKESIN